MIFGCARWKTAFVKQSRQFLIGHDCFTMPIFVWNSRKSTDNLNDFYCRLKKHPHPLWTPLHTTINTSSNPPLPHTCNSVQRRSGAPGLPETEKEKSTRPRRCHTSLSENLCWPAGPHLHKDLHRSLELCEVPSCFKRSTIIPFPKKSKITGLND